MFKKDLQSFLAVLGQDSARGSAATSCILALSLRNTTWTIYLNIKGCKNLSFNRKGAFAYLTQVFQKIWFQTHAREVLCK